MPVVGSLERGALFLLTDYGRADEFVGVLHAVAIRLAPGAPIVDLSHEVPPFDVAHGARLLERAAPHLGPGVVVGVVDPGVGGPRRAVAVEVAIAGGPDSGQSVDSGQSAGGGPAGPAWAHRGPRFWVGPDNGLLLPGAAAVGAIVGAVELLGPGGGRSPEVAGPSLDAVTFDGRDRFVLAAAALWRGEPLASLGPAIDPIGLVAPPPPVHEVVEATNGAGDTGDTEPGVRGLRLEVTWVDRFGNVQLAADAVAVPPDAGPVTVLLDDGTRPVIARRVHTFSDLAPGELGLIADANGHLALVRLRSSAAADPGLATGRVVGLRWRVTGTF